MASATFALLSAPVAARAGVAPRRCATAAPRSGVVAAARLSAAHSAAFGQRAVLGRATLSRPAQARGGVAPRAMARFETERTYIMIKPDGVQRGLVGDIISRFEAKGFVLKGLKLFKCPQQLAEEHYKDLSAKPFFKDLVAYIISGPVVAMVWEGPGAVKAARKLIGATNPLEAEPGTIRGDLAVETGRNVIHGSDSVENGAREIALWFGSDATPVEWTPSILPWLREL